MEEYGKSYKFLSQFCANCKKEKKRGTAVKLYLIISDKNSIMKIVSKLAMSGFARYKTHNLKNRRNDQ